VKPASGAKLLGALGLLVSPCQAQEIVISEVEQFTENRGWNEAGIGPTYQIVVAANVVPSGFPTLLFLEQGTLREPATHFPQRSTPDLYVYWKRFDPALTGAWRIIAERGDAKGAAAMAPALARPQQVPLALDVRVQALGEVPRLSWKLPDLAGFDIERIRVGIRGGPRVQGRFLSLLYVSEGLPASATTFTIPAGVLAKGERYVFQVMLEDLEGGRLENRSIAFSDPYSVSP
jgi:hypothetical protein